MKKVLVFLFAILLSFNGAADDGFSFEVIRPAKLQKGPLFDQTMMWVAEKFVSAKQVIELKDKDMGTIVGNGSADINIGFAFLPVMVPATFKMKIDVKDNKYRMTFSNVSLIIDGRIRPIEDTNRAPNEESAREKFQQIADSLEAYLAKPPSDF